MGSPRPQRIDTNFADIVKRLMAERVSKGLSKWNKNELSLIEGTRLILKTDGWKLVENELKTKPKRYDK